MHVSPRQRRPTIQLAAQGIMSLPTPVAPESGRSTPRMRAARCDGPGGFYPQPPMPGLPMGMAAGGGGGGSLGLRGAAGLPWLPSEHPGAAASPWRFAARLPPAESLTPLSFKLPSLSPRDQEQQPHEQQQPPEERLPAASAQGPPQQRQRQPQPPEACGAAPPLSGGDGGQTATAAGGRAAAASGSGGSPRGAAAPPPAPAPPTPPAPLPAVLLECTHAPVDLRKLPREHQQCSVELGSCGGGEPCAVVGRAKPRKLFEALVPDEGQRNLISRSHFELRWEEDRERLRVKSLSANVLLLGGIAVPQGRSMTVAPGAELGLCGADGVEPLLTFRVRLPGRSAEGGAGGAAAGTELPPLAAQPAAGQRGRPAAAAASAAAATGAAAAAPSYELAAIFLQGCDLAGLDPEASVVSLPSELPAAVGRQHQGKFFEALLRRVPSLLTCVSRSHFELAPAEGRPGHLQLTNLSANRLGVCGREVSKGERLEVRVPVEVDFLCPSPGGGAGESQPFLTLLLAPRGQGLGDAAAPAGGGAAGATLLERPPELVLPGGGRAMQRQKQPKAAPPQTILGLHPPISP